LKSVSVYLAISTLLLAGCSSGAGLLNGKETVPTAASVPVGNSLAMPPDLQLAPPNGTSDAYAPNGAVASAAATPAAPTTRKQAALAATNTSLYGGTPAAAAPPGDIFAQYGISRTKPDGTQKSQQQLNQELADAIRKKKQQTNPNYGTVSNIGAIFKDQ
jgi:hypothetical protein